MAKKGMDNIASMTGFGSFKAERQGVMLEVEIKTVNNRFLDCVFRLPRIYGQFEPDLRELVASRLHRGRVDVSVLRTVVSQESCQLELNRALFNSYMEVFDQLCAEHKYKDDNAKLAYISEVLLKRDVLEKAAEACDSDIEKEFLLEVVAEALQQLVSMRLREGERLVADILERIKVVQDIREKVLNLSKGSVEQQKEKLYQRVKQLEPELAFGEERLLTEVAILADRIDVTEELVRLKSHFGQFHDIIGVSPCGRKLEFLLQEIGREFNTVNSKAQNSGVQALVVEAKAQLEKIREQVQNIE